MKNIRLIRKLLWVFCFFTLISCEDKMEKHYERPDWLRTSTWEVLEREGSYSIFLEGVELAGFRPYLEGKGIATVMAPNDASFIAYLEEKGYSSIRDMPINEIKKLIGFHLLYYSYSKANMENFRPEGEGATDGGNVILDPGMYYKFRTRSSSPVTQHTDLTSSGSEKTLMVYHLERFIPVFSHNFFSSKKIDAKRNYEFFYPGSVWTGDEGFNVSNASVTEYALMSNNGYVYKIDRVLEPLETIYDELKKNPKYSEFLQLYDKSSQWIYDATLTADFGSTLGADSLYLFTHRAPLPPIALEWPISNYVRLDILAYKSYSVFAPSNTALNNFFDNYWKESGYPSLQELDPLVVRILLSEYVYSGSVAFPEEIATGKVANAFGLPFDFNPYTVEDKKMCVNGTYYGVDKIEVPLLFKSVAGPALRWKSFDYFLYSLSVSNLLNSFASDKVKYTLLMPDAQTFEASRYQLATYGTEHVLEGLNDVGEMTAVGEDVAKNIVNSHYTMEEVNLMQDRIKICPITIPYNYWYVKNGKITSSQNFNKILNPDVLEDDIFVALKEVDNNGMTWTNGKVYSYSAPTLGLFEVSNKVDKLQKTLAICNDRRYPYYAFVQLMKKAGMVSGESIGLTGRFILFAPTNEAIRTGLANNKIQGATNASLAEDGTLSGVFNKAELKQYLLNYFIPASTISTCPYPGSKMTSGEYYTYGGEIMEYKDDSKSLTIKLKRENTLECPVSAKYDYFPFAYSDGCFHLIESLLF